MCNFKKNIKSFFYELPFLKITTFNVLAPHVASN